MEFGEDPEEDFLVRDILNQSNPDDVAEEKEALNNLPSDTSYGRVLQAGLCRDYYGLVVIEHLSKSPHHCLTMAGVLNVVSGVFRTFREVQLIFNLMSLVSRLVGLLFHNRTHQGNP